MNIKMDKLFYWFLNMPGAKVKYRLSSSERIPLKYGDILEDTSILNLDSAATGWPYGQQSLRNAVVESQKYEVTEDEVMITTGTNEANYLTIATLVNPGDEVILEMPSWSQPHFLCEAMGAKVHILKRKEENGWKFDFDELNEMCSRDTKLVYICNPNNPTGAVFLERDIKRICKILQDYGVYLLCDEVYRGLEWNSTLSPSAVNYYEKAVSTASVSKTLGLVGLRIGWMATQDKELRHNCMLLRNHVTEATNYLGEYIATIALQPEKFRKIIDEGKRFAKENLKVVSDWISKSEVFSWIRPEAGFLSVPRYNLKIGSWEFCKRLRTEYETDLIPGICYDEEHHVRLGFCRVSKETIEGGLRRVDDFVQHIKKELK
jgi:hypothetical protein